MKVLEPILLTGLSFQITFGAVTPGQPFQSLFDAKPIEQMTFSELLITGIEALNNVTMLPNVMGNIHVHRLQEVLRSLSKTLPLVTYDESISPIERGLDGLVHNVFHPVDYAERQVRGARWDARHITASGSASGILRGLALILCIYMLVGFIVLSKYYSAEGMERIPHLQFWVAYPSLVLDGIYYVKDLTGFSNGMGTNGTYERIVNPSTKFGSGRDTFSQFEPI
jgi:hypothetical protein